MFPISRISTNNVFYYEPKIVFHPHRFQVPSILWKPSSWALRNHIQRTGVLACPRPHPSLAWHSVEEATQFSFCALGQKENSEICLQHSDLSVGCLRDRLLSHLTLSTGGNSGILWIPVWSPRKAVVPAELHENCWETSGLVEPGTRNYRQRNMIEHLRPWDEARIRLLGKLQHLKTAMFRVELVGTVGVRWTDHTHRPREDVYTENAWEELKHHMGWWPMVLPYKELLCKYWEAWHFSNAQLSTEDYKTYK